MILSRAQRGVATIARGIFFTEDNQRLSLVKKVVIVSQRHQVLSEMNSVDLRTLVNGQFAGTAYSYSSRNE